MSKLVCCFQWREVQTLTWVAQVHEEDLKDLLGTSTVEEAMETWEGYTKQERYEFLRDNYHALSAVTTDAETAGILEFREVDGTKPMKVRVTQF